MSNFRAACSETLQRHLIKSFVILKKCMALVLLCLRTMTRKQKKRLRAITEEELNYALSYIPSQHESLVRGKFRLLSHQMMDANGKIIAAHYDNVTDSVLIYGFDQDDISHGVHLEIIWHEVGHVFFEKALGRLARARWEQERNKDLPFPILLSDIYTKAALWEEEFCFTYALMIRERFYRENHMKMKVKKTARLGKEIPKRSEFVGKLIADADKKKNSEGCYQEAMRRFDEWAGKLK